MSHSDCHGYRVAVFLEVRAEAEERVEHRVYNAACNNQMAALRCLKLV